jgi:hypothetical protein
MKSTVLAVRIAAGIFLALGLTGCVGYVRGDGGVEVTEPDLYLFGGYYDQGPYRDYDRRGEYSRRFVGRDHDVPVSAPAPRPAAAPAPRPGDPVRVERVR